VKLDWNLRWLAAGVFVGILAGVSAYQLGVEYACPSRTCVDGADVTPVTDRGYFDHAFRIISEADESIHIVAFEVKYYSNFPSSLQNQLVRQLIYAKQRGVDVKVIVDDFSEENNAFDILTENGIEVRYDSNETTTHAKLIIVDGRIVLLGSTNLSFYGLEQNNEANVLIEDARTAQYYEKYFRSLWDGA